MAIDQKIIETEQKAMRDVKTVFVSTYKKQKPAGKFIMVLVILIIAVVALWIIGSSIAGFMSTPLGLAMIALSIIAVVFYFWMRLQGVGMKSISGGLLEVALILMVLIVYVGLLESLMEWFLMAFPLIIIGIIGWLGYKWWIVTEDVSKKGAVVLAVAVILIGFPIFQAFVVPYTIGEAKDLVIKISRDDTGEWYAYGEIMKPAFIKTMSTSFNPYANAIAETSNWMWTNINTREKASVDIRIYKELGFHDIHTEIGKTIYVGYSDVHTIWGIIHLPVEGVLRGERIDMVIRVYDQTGLTLAMYRGVYYT